MLEASLIAITILAFVALGYELALRIFGVGQAAGGTENQGPQFFERACAAVSIGASCWIASVWLVALFHQLDRPTLLSRTISVAATAIALFLRRTRGRTASHDIPRETVLTFVLPTFPIVAWIVWILWRSALIPPLSHDALAYHLPRAVLWIREHAFAFLNLPVDVRMRVLPANYELLLADVILLGNGDALTEWVSVFFYLAFVIACAAVAERWTGSRTGAFAVAILAAATPVLLLQAGADKNDIMTAFFMVAAIVWAGRWISEGDAASLILCALTLAAAIGTKPQGVMLAAALLPLLLWRFLRELRAKRITDRWVAIVLSFSVLAVILLGGWFFIARLLSNPPSGDNFVAYDEWMNLWQAPWVLITAPFSANPFELWVPWEENRWFWQRNEIYFSHLGLPFALCALFLPLFLLRLKNVAPERRLERNVLAIAATVALFLMFPVRDKPMPHGVYLIALPRYVLFIVPVVLSLTIAPLVARLKPLHARIAIYLFTAWFVREAAYAIAHDRFVPLDFIEQARANPGTRVIPFDMSRAASVVDRLAGPTDKVAFDAGYAAWIHPAFGRDLQRPVTFIDPAEGLAGIPDDARWVVIDRGFRSMWQHENLRDLSQYRGHLGRGRPSDEELRMLRALLKDARFQPVYVFARRNQAVFRRK
ncbi:MAG TPA: glycosyltransferase family 39 protein [Thermoanaerobaculia bacterium]|nr:glycosyltransferase family 39 protein [Thermoanaerobaculia bacterium]